MIGDTALRRKILHRITSDNRHEPTRTMSVFASLEGAFLTPQRTRPVAKTDKAALTHPQSRKELEFSTI